MELSLYDTQSRSEKIVTSKNSEVITIYCCGPTVYRDAHIGNLRTFLLTDLVVRALHFFGKKTLVVQNITDVGHMTDDFEEDKLLAQGKSESRSARDVARDYEGRFHRDLAHLNISPADHYPRASESIDLMFAHIQKLIDLGHAYVGTDNTVYFSAKSFPTYGAISGNTLEKLKPGHRYDYVDDGAKQFHADWALWKSSPNRNEMVWNSPWGTGFPGWHIECSAMSLKFLAGHVDLHIGGIDLRFPHHENERAQSNPIVNGEAVSQWLHGEHLLFEGRKMSKSAGNVVLVSHLLDKGLDPLALRFCFLENRYRSQMDLSWESITAAHQTLAKWRLLAASTQPTARDSIQALNQEVREIVNEIVSAFCDDLDTPRAMQILRSAVKSSLADNLKSSLLHAVEPIFGLALTRPINVKEPSSEILQLLEERRAARAAKDFKLSDALRKRLDELGIAIHDGPDGQRWEWKI
jgi:cysteinyl-tRNA synthetase